MKAYVCCFLLLTFVFYGCTTVPRKNAAGETDEEVISALESVAGGMTGKELSREELEQLADDLENDPEAKSAVESISGAMLPIGAAVKYCPLDGKRYSAELEICPEHGELLKLVE